MSKKEKWMPIINGQPEEDRDYFVTYDTGCAYLVTKSYYSVEGGWAFTDFPVIAWMKITSLPRLAPYLDLSYSKQCKKDIWIDDECFSCELPAGHDSAHLVAGNNWEEKPFLLQWVDSILPNPYIPRKTVEGL